MIHTWEEADVKPGTLVATNKHKERYIIGFYAAWEGEKRYTLISLLDGMIVGPKTKLELAAMLTKDNFWPVLG